MGLQYDDAAWSYFLLTFLSLYLLPSYLHILSLLLSHLRVPSPSDLGAVARTAPEKIKAENIVRTNTNKYISIKAKVNMTVTLILTVVFILTLSSITSDGEISVFDPYQILGLDPAADSRAIKQAYRKKSLRYHPDKNPDDPSAEAMFMMIAKAYESLTDPAARENWEKYGNPDGKQSMEVSIGLPTFFLDSEWKHTILLVYLFCMVVLIPACVWLYYSNSSKYGERGVMYKTWGWLNHAVNELLTYRGLPEVLAGCAEFHERLDPTTDANSSKEEMQEMQRLQACVKNHMNRPKYNHVLVVKGNLLLHAHLTRTEVNVPSMKADLDYMLCNCANLLDAMIDHSHQRGWLKPAMEIVMFTQRLTQAVWAKDSSLLQLPHFTEKEAEHVNKGKKPNAKNFKDYLALPDAEKKGLADFTGEQKADVLAVTKLIPNLDVSAAVFVEDDEDNKVYQNDLITVRVSMNRLNLETGEEAGLVHAPYFPVPKLEAWWVILATKEGKIVNVQKVTDKAKEFHHDIKFMAPPPGKYDMNIHVMSNAYVDLDVSIPVTFDVLSADLLPEYKPHKEDMMLDDEPTVFEQMMAGNIEEDSDDDDSDDETSAAANLQKRGAKEAADDDDDDSDDDDSDAEPTLEKEEAKKDK